MVEINLIYKMKNGKKNEFLELINSLGIPQAVRNENGCIKYEFTVSEDKDEIYLNELWESDEALDCHKQQEHLTPARRGSVPPHLVSIVYGVDYQGI